jgi:hypothetical protein
MDAGCVSGVLTVPLPVTVIVKTPKVYPALVVTASAGKFPVSPEYRPVPDVTVAEPVTGPEELPAQGKESVPLSVPSKNLIVNGMTIGLLWSEGCTEGSVKERVPKMAGLLKVTGPVTVPTTALPPGS